MTRDPQGSARILLEALDVFEAACKGLDPVHVVPAVRAMVDTVPEEQLRAVATALAVEGVWSLPPAAVRPRTDVEIDARLCQVRAWIDRVRLEARWVAS